LEKNGSLFDECLTEIKENTKIYFSFQKDIYFCSKINFKPNLIA
jgi:hypothetical protein